MTKAKNNVKPKIVNPKEQFERRIITAIRDSKPVSPEFDTKPEIKLKKSEVARKIISEIKDRIPLDEGIARCEALKPSKNYNARAIWSWEIEMSKFATIVKEGDKKFVKV